MNEVVLSELAEADLTDIWVFIARDDLQAANRLLDQIYEKWPAPRAFIQGGSQTTRTQSIDSKLSGRQLCDLLS